MVPREYQRKLRRPGPRLLGLDLGERRIGVAVPDETGVIASPLRIIDLRQSSFSDVARLAEELHVDGVVIGLPKGMTGDEGHQARATRAMAAELAPFLSVPILFWDERLSSAIAERVLVESGRRTRERRGQRDAIAAAVMLQSYVDANPWGGAE